jgi:hypothetical protein
MILVRDGEKYFLIAAIALGLLSRVATRDLYVGRVFCVNAPNFLDQSALNMLQARDSQARRRSMTFMSTTRSAAVAPAAALARGNAPAASTQPTQTGGRRRNGRAATGAIVLA